MEIPDSMAKGLAERMRWQAEKESAPIATRNAVWELNDAVRELHEATLGLRTSTERSSRVMVWLTVALVILTLWIAALTVVAVIQG